MDVETAPPRSSQNRLGQDQAVSGDHGGVDIERGEGGLLGRVPQRRRRPHLDLLRLGPALDGGGGRRLAAPGRPRRLGVDRGDVVAGVDQRVERRHREFGGSHEGEAHGRFLCPEFGLASKAAPSYRWPMASQEIEVLAQALAGLPGPGPRSARRAVLHLMKKRETALAPLLRALETVSERLSVCSTCGNVDTADPCTVCADPRRDARLLCIVEEVSDLWALDRSRLFPGRFHVLGGRLSALEGVRPEDLAIDKLIARVAAGGIDEVVLAMNATLEGQTTAHYLAERLERFPVRITQLAHGLAVGGGVDYLDEGTLAQALRARRPVA